MIRSLGNRIFQPWRRQSRVRGHGDRAHATSDFQASHMLDGERVVLAGWYDTHLKRERGRWRISRNQLNATWTQGPPALYAQAAERFAASQTQD